MKICVIGIGNTLRGDDGLGYRAAELLLAESLPPSVHVLAVHQVTPELADELQSADLAVFIDANCQAQPGSIECREIEPYLRVTPVTHTFEPAQILEITRFLYGRSPRGILFTVGAQDFRMGEGFCPAVEATLPQLVDQLLLFLDIQLCQGRVPSLVAV